MITEFSKISGISVRALLSRGRQADVVAARQVYWYLLRQSGYTYPEIARLNAYHHTSVMYAVRHVEELLSVSDAQTTGIFNKTKHLIEPKMSERQEMIIVSPSLNGDERLESGEFPCPKCHGRGGWHYDEHDKGGERFDMCPACAGTGRVKAIVTIVWKAADSPSKCPKDVYDT